VSKEFKENSPKVRTVLLVDDNDESRVLMKFFLDNVGYAVDSAQNAEEALSRFNSNIHDLILTDNSMPGMTGLEMTHIIKLRSPTTPVIMYTGNPPNEYSVVDLMIPKPAHLLDIKEAIDRLFKAI
jgi:CheY-like chemotaxis protein